MKKERPHGLEEKRRSFFRVTQLSNPHKEIRLSLSRSISQAPLRVKPFYLIDELIKLALMYQQLHGGGGKKKCFPHVNMTNI